MAKKIYVSVSTDPEKDLSKVVDYAKCMQGEADMLHCDIMDAKFVKKKTYDHVLLDKINDNTLIMLDVHLMCGEPLKSIKDYLKAGANILTVHYEAFENKNDLAEAAAVIHEANALAGISICPSTSVSDIKMYINMFDVVLVMSVVPGESGQSFMPAMLDKIKELDDLRKGNDYNFKIEVDGGINGENVQAVIDAGADMIVSGSYVYNASDRKQAIDSLRGKK
ncbi:MAG: ribulose-phosphate 3-epimerase [Clostridia bacterium]|nr:ribulose-phosphate 3-epimerase [Clostridia bacterium]